MLWAANDFNLVSAVYFDEPIGFSHSEVFVEKVLDAKNVLTFLFKKALIQPGNTSNSKFCRPEENLFLGPLLLYINDSQNCTRLISIFISAA